MKFAKVNGIKRHAKDVESRTMGKDLWFTDYDVIAYVGRYRQYWKYVGEKPEFPPGYERETEWHAAWKTAIQDEFCEVICGENKEHRADIKTNENVIEIQKSRIDGNHVVERNNFYRELTGSRVIWIVNIEDPWKEKRITTEFVPNEKDGRFIINWKNKWKWVEEISITTDTQLYLDFNPQSDKLIKMWTYKKKSFGKWIKKIDFFNDYMKNVSKEEYCNDDGSKFLEIFKGLNS